MEHVLLVKPEQGLNYAIFSGKESGSAQQWFAFMSFLFILFVCLFDCLFVWVLVGDYVLSPPSLIHSIAILPLLST